MRQTAELETAVKTCVNVVQLERVKGEVREKVVSLLDVDRILSGDELARLSAAF